MPSFPVPINPITTVLQERHISADEGIGLGLKDVSTRELQDIFGTSAVPLGITGVALPYFDLDGSELMGKNNEPFVRYRLRGDLPKGIGKYRQKRGSGLAAYIPRLNINWVEVAHDTSQPIWITEGEFKSISVTQQGIPCVGLGGVDNWREKDGSWARPLDNFQWVGRTVFIVYDADKESTEEHPYKPQVEGAAKRLAARLFESGAQVLLLYIARTDTFRTARAKNVEVKQGIDDYLEAGGKLEDLLKTADPASEDAIMARLLREYAVYMGGKPHIVRLSDGVPFKRGEFTDVIEASALRKVPKQKGGYAEVRVADEWLKNQDRFEIDRYVFKPGEAGGYGAEQREYNIWGGFAVEGAAGDGYLETVKIWKKFVSGLFGEYADYFERWIAHMFQRPGEKTTNAVILASVLNGIGKSLLGEVIRGIVGREGSVAVELDRLKSNFNKVLERKLFVQMDEADGTFLGLESKLKDLVTADTVVIEPKGFDAYVVDNYARIFMTSNSTRPIRLDAENRRFLVIVPELTVRDAKGEWGVWVRDVVARRLKSEEGMRDLRWHLDRVDLTGWEPMGRVPVTPAMMDMIESGRTKTSGVVDGLWEALQDDPDGVWALTSELTKQGDKIWGDLKAQVKAQGGQTMSHVYKTKGKTVKCVLLDRDGKLPRKMRDGQWVLDNNGHLTAEQCLDAAMRATKAYNEWGERVRSDKY